MVERGGRQAAAEALNAAVQKARVWMARAPSYDFERRERQKAKDAKRAEKTQAKRDKKANAAGMAQGAQAQQVIGEMDVSIAEDTLKKG